MLHIAQAKAGVQEATESKLWNELETETSSRSYEAELAKRETELSMIVEVSRVLIQFCISR